MSTGSAGQIVTDTVEAAKDVFGPEIQAIFTLGSLAHGGFAPLVSDIDVAIVLAKTTAETADKIAQLQGKVEAKASNELASRLSLFYGDWQAVRTGEGEHFRLGPIDRLDLLDDGKLLLGTDRREPSTRPSHEELIVMSADFILRKFTDDYLDQLRDTETLVAGGERLATKVVLFPVRFLYTLKTGQIGLNDGSVAWYAAEQLPGSALAQAAIDWRNDGLTDPDAAHQLLDAELVTLHAECLAEYTNDLDAMGDITRAEALAERAEYVRAQVERYDEVSSS
jgi:predicted nucleotidyltransferase